MIDPRSILLSDLMKAGISKSTAQQIAIDAGSSQTVVDIDYVDELSLDKLQKILVFECVSKFYFGYASKEN